MSKWIKTKSEGYVKVSEITSIYIAKKEHYTNYSCDVHYAIKARLTGLTVTLADGFPDRLTADEAARELIKSFGGEFIPECKSPALKED